MHKQVTSSKPCLWQYPPGFGLPSLSPFCVKVEAFLKLSGIDYQIRRVINPRMGPFGKMPVMEIDGEIIGDSRVIVEELTRRFDVRLDQHLDRKSLANGHAFARMVEEHLYFVIMYSRWVDPEGLSACFEEFKSAFPLGMRRLAFTLLSRNLQRQCLMQGLGKLPKSRIYDLGVLDIEAIEAQIGDGFLLGDAPSSFDCPTYAFLKTICNFPVPNPLNVQIRNSQKLNTYIQRMDERLGFSKSSNA
jgi:glutathione S-transferase